MKILLTGAGGQVGPDLTSTGASPQPDYVVDSLLLPHKAIKAGFDVTRVSEHIQGDTMSHFRWRCAQ